MVLQLTGVGIADGSKRSLLDIIALNVRTEIAFGQFSDGCTSLSWKTEKRSLLGQNWDVRVSNSFPISEYELTYWKWETEQKKNLVLLTIESEGLPTIKMITEGGIIGKIGCNSAGVGVCLNAIKAKGCDDSRMPVHLGLRTVLESSSTREAIALLERYGMASSAHFLIADGEEAVGLEFTSTTFAKLLMNSHGRVCHTNHLIAEHLGVYEPGWLPDSRHRVSRMEALVAEKFDDSLKAPALLEFAGLFEDEEGFPSSICRAEQGISDSATLFNMCMDLKARKAVVKMGRPSSPEETIELDFGPK